MLTPKILQLILALSFLSGLGACTKSNQLAKSSSSPSPQASGELPQVSQYRNQLNQALQKDEDRQKGLGQFENQQEH
jgi:hypothetical protein